MASQVTSLRVDTDLWKDAKKRAIDRNSTIGEYIDNLIRADLARKK